MLQKAWRSSYNLPFPIKHLDVFPARKYASTTCSCQIGLFHPLSPTLANVAPIVQKKKQTQAKQDKDSRQNVSNRIVGTGNQYVVKDVPHLYGIELQRTLDRNAASHALIEALRLVLKRNQSKTTELAKFLIAGFAAARPYISTTHIEHLLVFGRLTLLWEVAAELDISEPNGGLS